LSRYITIGAAPVATRPSWSELVRKSHPVVIGQSTRLDREQVLFGCLRLARKEGQPWHTIARLLQAHLQRVSSKQARLVIWEGASSATELTSGVLRRYVAVIDELETISQKTGRPIETLLSPSFPAVENAVRLYEHDASEGIRALEQLRCRSSPLPRGN